MKAPFPYFGGKSAVASLVWDALGSVSHYVEPFFGSGAVFLAAPKRLKLATVNDMDSMLCNFWRAVRAEPEAVARVADWPCNETDLHARHSWLVGQRDSMTELLTGDPDAYDVKTAGWWVWGACNWIGGGWCSGEGPWVTKDGALVDSRIKGDAGRGINRQLPHMAAGQGINRKLPHMGDAGRLQFVTDWMVELADALRGVRVACGDWSRVTGPSVLRAGGAPVGVFLDPPYDQGERVHVYACETPIAADVRAWCAANGGDKALRIVLAGYDGEHNELEALGWRVQEWKARGGYGSQGDERGRENAKRERLWFSPHCLGKRAPTLFERMHNDPARTRLSPPPSPSRIGARG